MPTGATVQADVGPGNETGIYYITICNLPFGTSWQQLKDWTRTACVVDHIEVFQSSTSGWVRVRGRENFEKAWGLLNGGIFNGRSIIASDKNRNHPIKIRELAIPQKRTQRQTQRYQHAPPIHHVLSVPMATAAPYSVPPEQYYMTGYSPANGPRFTSHSVPQGYVHQTPIIVTTEAPIRPATYQTAGPGSYYAYDMGSSPNTVTYVPQYRPERMQFSQSYSCPDEHSDFYPKCGFPIEEPSEYIATEPHKLHVSPFPQQAEAHEVKAWIRHKVDKTNIHSIEIPKNSNSRYLRGYVLVEFDSASAANTAIERLNKARFQGRRVIARPTREGAEIGQPGFLHETTAWSDTKLSETNIAAAPSYERDEDNHRDDKPQKPKNREVRSTGPEKKRTTEKKLPPTGRKTAVSQTDKKSPSKSPSSNRELGRKDGGPVVVDGTCHRRDKQ
ncbi:unnamed protein product [Fusarium graminearum]|uniref:Chromosome 4, complete genome n=2 Tax=Gibberella zeae TaxID=5518 RepID=A0A098DM63_GIBZE|nr:hypothetical protein HG531_011718 [Fusarium graminearum]PCD19638.1 hypothetical protein FGRA07_05387 [Fusarium graminearum]CAF3440263.1 unnamed protein product [Fusarium graminearum]CAF3465822.1 unnamed protein product [Fusarium graminearum]CAF3608067.1 unnamed protein product [Fusarium graminearum]